MGGAYCGVVSLFIVSVPCRCRRRGPWFPFMGAGGFHDGGSCFCACGHLFLFVLGRMSLFGWSSSLSGWSDNDEVAMSLSAMWRLGCVSVKTKEGMTYCAW